MEVHILDKQNTILNRFISEIRDSDIQQDAMRFRRNVERIGELLAYELSKTLEYSPTDVNTPLGLKHMQLPKNDIVLCSVLRAGLPLHRGLLNYFDRCENAFISAFRKHSDPKNFEIIVEYLASPDLSGKTLILVDPMLATGRSMVSVFEGLKNLGTPKDIHVACVIGSEDGIEFISEHLPDNVHLWIATVDKGLNDKSYIVPGLGDAGDLAFGQKL